MALLLSGNGPRSRNVFIFSPASPTNVFSGVDKRGYMMSYTPGEGFVDVIVNGTWYAADEIEAKDGSSVKLLHGMAGSTDKVVIIAQAVDAIANTYTQAQSDERYKRKLAVDGGNGTDLNTLTTPGLYYVAGALNCPFSGYVYVDVVTTGGWWRQNVYQFGSNEAATRAYDGNTTSWTPWVSLIPGDGGAELYRVDANTVGVRAVNGGRLKIAGISRPVTAGTLTKTGLATSTRHYVYAVWNGTQTVYEWSTTAPVMWSDGTMVKSGDANRALVGMALVMGDTVSFHDEPTRRTVLTWHNKKPKNITQYSSSGGTAQAGALASIGATSWFLCWRDQAIELKMAGYVTTNATDYVFTAPKLGSTEGAQHGQTHQAGQYWAAGGSLSAQNLTDNLFDFTCGARTTGVSTATIVASVTGIIWG
jgi:hypothetical protein